MKGNDCEYCGPKLGSLNLSSPDLNIPEQPHKKTQVIAKENVRGSLLLIAVQVVWMSALAIDVWFGLVRKIHYGGTIAALRAVYLIGLVYQTSFYVKHKHSRAMILISAVGAIFTAMSMEMALVF
jgi:hypothetical protein